MILTDNKMRAWQEKQAHEFAYNFDLYNTPFCKMWEQSYMEYWTAVGWNSEQYRLLYEQIIGMD